MSDKSFYPYGRQWIDEADLASVVETLQSDFLTTGPKVESFEESLCELTGARFSSVVNSGTSALHAAYAAVGLEPGDEIITSPLTFAATANAARYIGADVKFVDIDEATGNIDPNLIESNLSSKTKIIVPIDYAGQPADYAPINELAETKNLITVADASHSLGAKYKGKNVGTLADLTTTSFHPLKIVTTAEGGAVFTNNQIFDVKTKQFRTHGITKDPSSLMFKEDEGPWYHEMQSLGFNYRLSDVHAALGLSQLRKHKMFVERRTEIASKYDSALRGFSGIRLPSLAEDRTSAWHLYVIRVLDGKTARKKLFAKLQELGLGVQVHYIPVYWHPYYRNLGFKKGICPKAEKFYEQAISLPIYPSLSDKDFDEILTRTRDALRAIS